MRASFLTRATAALSTHERTSLEMQIANLAQAIKLGGSLPPLLRELTAPEQRRADLAARLDGLTRARTMTETDVRRFESEILTRLDDWRGLLRCHPARRSPSNAHKTARWAHHVYAARGARRALLRVRGPVFVRQGDSQRFATDPRGSATRRSPVAPRGFDGMPRLAQVAFEGAGLAA